MNILKYPQLKFYPFHMAIDPGKLWSPTLDNLVTFDMVSHWPLQIVHTHSPCLLPQLHLQPLDLSVNDGELLRPQPPLLKLLVHVQAEETSQRWTERWRWLWGITMDCYHCEGSRWIVIIVLWHKDLYLLARCRITHILFDPVDVTRFDLASFYVLSTSRQNAD